MIKVLEKANRLLLLVAGNSPVSFGDLLYCSGFNKATLSQILKTMVQLSWLSRGEDGAFVIGSGISVFAESIDANQKLRKIYCQAVEKFNQGMNEIVTIAIFKDGNRQVIAKHEGNHFVKVSESSSSLPASMFSTATGLALLSGMDETVREVFIKKNKMHTEFAKSAAAMAFFKKNGFCEFTIGRSDAFAIAVGIYDSFGKMAASMGFSAPCYRFDKNQKNTVVKKLKQYALEIGKSL